MMPLAPLAPKPSPSSSPHSHNSKMRPQGIDSQIAEEGLAPDPLEPCQDQEIYEVIRSIHESYNSFHFTEKTVKLTITAKGATLRWLGEEKTVHEVKRGSDSFRTEPRQENQRVLSSHELTHFRKLLETSHFWSAPSGDPLRRPGPRPSATLNACQGDKSHWAYRTEPKTGRDAILEAAKYLEELAQLPSPSASLTPAETKGNSP